MQAVILAGGLGTRLSEETIVKPKPMVKIGSRPILWHIMKIYSHYGINDFVICLGYKGYMIKEYFANYCLHMSDVTFDMNDGSMRVHRNTAESWKVTLVDTGDDTLTGGRLLRVKKFMDDSAFCFTYGDGVADIDIAREVAFHKRMNVLATMAAVQPPGRYGHMDIIQDKVAKFEEKTQGDGGWINGGFFVLEPEIFDYIEGDATPWETRPLERLAAENQLAAYKHGGFWRPMDTLRDKNQLEELWDAGKAPWKMWE
ncbi:MAG: glucose-1-phosphate cytidylyltransferase [Synergistaceae bacterium]|jgi:glucose-1-phosphate cytidylyltransferase|nr:glucose-1-phosphate cytidylyltransferase [Synergistaceae bacterium]